MWAVIYLRVSSEEQVEGWSLEAQQQEGSELCQTRGWQLLRVYADEGKSAWNESSLKRPVFRQLLLDAEARRFDVVIVHSLDRWSRNLRVTLDSFKVLSDHNIAFVSIREQIDYTTPEGRLFLAMLGAFAQYYSDVLAMHVKKAVKVRASHGLHVGPVPFGYAPCGDGCPGERCKGGIHPVEKEAEAVIELFRRYSTATCSLSQLAESMNEQGFLTRNIRAFTTSNGETSRGPRAFSLYSVRDILHNPFYTGKLLHRGSEHQGAHESIIDEALFKDVQSKLRRARSRDHTAGPRYRPYLLKGLVCCVHCGLSLWADTPASGYAYYREKRNTRPHNGCPANGKSVKADKIDGQINWLVRHLAFKTEWRQIVLGRVQSSSERERVIAERKKTEARLGRLKQMYLLGDVSESEYLTQRRLLLDKLQCLVIPDADEVIAAGDLLANMGNVWEQATLEERHGMLKSMVSAVYIDLAGTKSVIGIVPNPAFYPLFAALRNEPENGVYVIDPNRLLAGDDTLEEDYESMPSDGAEHNNFWVWWRRGRVELPVQRKATQGQLQAYPAV